MRIAVIDHSFHATTKSTEFIDEIIAECGCIDKLYCDRWQGGRGVDLRALGNAQYDSIVFVQQMYRRRELCSISDPGKIILVPMYDGVADWSEAKWRRYRGFPIVAFSSTLHQAVKTAGCESVYVRYFPQSASRGLPHRGDPATGLTVFFWERQPAISWPLVRQLLAGTRIAKLYYKPCPDPGGNASRISGDDRKRFNIEEVGWLSSREEYLRLVAQSHIFIAPRRFEGIGMSFLEAMALGAIVIAPHQATMNEYIEHGRNGILYELDDPKLDLSEYDLAGMMEQVRESSRQFAADWRTGREVFKTVVRAAGSHPPGRWAACQRWLRRSLTRGP